MCVLFEVSILVIRLDRSLVVLLLTNHLLVIVTTLHLPGTHGVALEGANVDIAVLMSCIRDSLPSIWAKLDDPHVAKFKGFDVDKFGYPRLISECATNWTVDEYISKNPECNLIELVGGTLNCIKSI